jgi:hypothetical protein
MTLHLPRLALALDPLIAEAKRRARQRRLLAALATSALVGGTVAATFALRSPSGSATPPGRLAPLSSPSFGGAPGAQGTIPFPLFESVHGRVIGWAKTGPDWFAVYVDKVGGDWCGLGHASWRIALVNPKEPHFQRSADRRVAPAMCGNELAWVHAGHFSDGLHREVAFFLWSTPAIGATAYIYRAASGHLRLLATFQGDSVKLTKGRVVVGFENRGRSPHGELEDLYRFRNGRYRLVRGR